MRIANRRDSIRRRVRTDSCCSRICFNFNIGNEMTQQSLFFLSKLLYRTLVTTALFLLGALIMWRFDGAPKHLSPPVSASGLPTIATPHATHGKHPGVRHETRR